MQGDFNPFSAQQRVHEERIYRQSHDDIVQQMLLPKKVKGGKSNKRIQNKSTFTLKQSAISSAKIKKIETVEVYFMSRTTFVAEKSLPICWQNKGIDEQYDLTIIKWMIDACVISNIINFLYAIVGMHGLWL